MELEDCLALSFASQSAPDILRFKSDGAQLYKQLSSADKERG